MTKHPLLMMLIESIEITNGWKRSRGSRDTEFYCLASAIGLGFYAPYSEEELALNPVSYTHLTLPTTSRV